MSVTLPAKRSRVLALPLLAYALGCSDTSAVVTQPTVSPVSTVAHTIQEGSPDAPPGVPEDMNFPTFIYSLMPDVGWADGYAYAQSNMDYLATNALARVNLSTSQGNSIGESELGGAFPASRSITASTAIAMNPCIGTLNANAYGKVWNQFGMVIWATKSDTRSKGFTCPSSPAGTGAGGSGGSTPGTRRCYTLTIDRYWWYPDLGILEYIGTDTYTWCDDQTI